MPGYEIARRTGLSPASVSRILRRARLSRWRDLNPPPPVVRYEHPRPGDLLHLDIKGMTRFSEVNLRGDGRLRGKRKHPGFLALHVAVDDHSRMAFTQLLPDHGPPLPRFSGAAGLSSSRWLVSRCVSAVRGGSRQALHGPGRRDVGSR
jgi:hypothetical protein